MESYGSAKSELTDNNAMVSWQFFVENKIGN